MKRAHNDIDFEDSDGEIHLELPKWKDPELDHPEPPDKKMRFNVG